MIDDLLKVVPAWLNFVLTFPVSPHKALAAYSGAGQVRQELTTLATAGVGVAYLIVAVMGPPQLGSDQGSVAGFLRRIDSKLLPALLVLGFVALGIVIHLATKVYSRGYFGGAVQDSVNGMLGLSAFFVPAATALFIVSVYFLLLNTEKGTMVAGLFSVVTAVAFVIYTPLALAAVHPNTSFVKAFVGLAGGAGILYAVAYGFAWLVPKLK